MQLLCGLREAGSSPAEAPVCRPSRAEPGHDRRARGNAQRAPAPLSSSSGTPGYQILHTPLTELLRRKERLCPRAALGHQEAWRSPRRHVQKYLTYLTVSLRRRTVLPCANNEREHVQQGL
jgi:hypothetical protein